MQRRKNIFKSTRVSPYHLFKVFDDCFIFDTTGCRFYKVDELTFDFLELRLKYTHKETVCRLQNRKKYSDIDIFNVAKEILFLEKYGLFTQVTTYIDLRHVKREMMHVNISGLLQDVQLMLAESCNLACTYCYCPSNQFDGGMMKNSVARKAIDLLAKQDAEISCVTMFGGEPLLNKPLVDFIIKYTKNLTKKGGKKFHYIITTNATLLDDKMINYIVNENFGLMVSLDGPKKLHDCQCPTKLGTGSYEIAVPKIKTLMRHRTVGVRATLAHPLPNLRELIDFFVEFGFNNMVLGTAGNRLDAPGKSDLTEVDMKFLIQQEEELLPWMQSFLDRGKVPPYFLYERWYFQIQNAEIYPRTHLFNCGAGHRVCGVDAHGILYPCAKFCGMKNWQIGNVSTGLNIEKSKNIWLKYLHCIKSKCGKCWAYPLCHGPCIWECAQNDGTFKFSSKYCDFMKKNIERSAYLYFGTQKRLDGEKIETFSGTTNSCPV